MNPYNPPNHTLGFLLPDGSLLPGRLPPPPLMDPMGMGLLHPAGHERRGRGRRSRMIADDYSSSEEFGSDDLIPSEDDQKSKKAKGKGKGKGLEGIEGGNGDTVGPEENLSSEEDPCEPGMACSLKNLYSGKEDKLGRFQWQNTIPLDVKHPVENKETAKFALLVRRIKVYSNPRKTLSVHSIVVQSPLLKNLLRKVLKDYPGLSVNLRRLELTGKFEPIIHRWGRLEDEIAKLGTSEEDLETKKHANLFFGVVKEEFKDLIESSQDMMSKGVITFEYLWTIFQPGTIVYNRHDGQETAFKLVSATYSLDPNTNRPALLLSGKYVDFDGSRFGTNRQIVMIATFSGTRKINRLSAFPIEFHAEKEELSQRLISRGSKVEALAGSNYKSYDGIGWKLNMQGKKDKFNVKGRVVIDTSNWNRCEPNFPIFVTPFGEKEMRAPNMVGEEKVDAEIDLEVDFDGDNDDGGMPPDGHFADEDDSVKRPALTTEQKMICSPLVRGYSLKTKMWLNFFANSVHEISWNTGAFDRLVLPMRQKELILGFTESQKTYKDSFDDVIEGKGLGMILLLTGPPGVGKTLTAESVAEEMKVPLYMMSAGDLGSDPRTVEKSLKEILELCNKWDAILLLDEADVFLEERSLHDLERNKLVSIFLRLLEYYEGIMFLTTNRVQTFDAAFQSRIHISIDYPELSIESRRTVWKNLLSHSGQENSITDAQFDQLSYMNMNGRQIKNVLKTAQLLSRQKKKVLGHEHVMTVLDVTQHLHNSTRENERTRASIFC